MVPRTIEIDNSIFQDNPGNPGYNPFYPNDIGKNIHFAVAPTNDLTIGFNHLNYVLENKIVVRNFNRIAGNNFSVFALEQAPNVIVPQTGLHIGIPQAGLTNTQAWAQYGKAIGGEIAPCLTRQVAIHGFICP